MAVDHYLGNPLLKKANTTQEFTEEQVLEFSRCIYDPIKTDYKTTIRKKTKSKLIFLVINKLRK